MLSRVPANPARRIQSPHFSSGYYRLPVKRRRRAYKSRAQWRYFFANPRLRRYARGKAHATKGPPKVRYRKLPERKRPPTARTLR